MARAPRRDSGHPRESKKPNTTLEMMAEVPDQPRPAHVVGVAGSAGSLEALKAFFGALPVDGGAAFLVCVHREARTPNLLSQLLSSFTAMPVSTLATGTLLMPDTVYVLPAARRIALSSGRAALGAQEAGTGQIDGLFQSLAGDEGSHAVGVLLSGMDSDGTLGLEAIRAAGGLSLVQAPGSAPFPTMPASAIDAGAADLVGSPEGLARELTTYLKRPPVEVARIPEDSAAQDRALLTILARIREHTGHDLSQYKRSPFLRRVERRMALMHVGHYAGYLALLDQDPAESKQLFKDLLIGVTRFFREPDAFEVLRATSLPRILADPRRAPPLRIWIAGCSTGEEAYSIAMVAREALDALPSAGDRALQIYATDLDEAAIERARRGRYPASIAEDISPPRLERFFTEDKDGYHAKPEIRDAIVFATHNLTADPPFTRLDLICCRNVLIYLGVEAQRKLLGLFHFALRGGGVLVLGGSEGLGTWERAFEVVDAKTRVFRRREVARSRRLPVDFPLQASTLALSSAHGAHRPSQEDAIRDLVRVALEEFGALGPGRARAKGTKKTSGSKKSELETVRRHFLTLTQNLESFRREAQVTHEELQSTNEELQSTNEELLTAREETQSMNEELVTLNAELSAKNEALENTNDDMRNLLDGSLIPTLFLDDALRIRRFTSQATRVANLIPTDVGRPITDIALVIDYTDLAADVRAVLRTRTALEKPVRGRDGSAFTMRIHPYRTASDLVDGVVLTFLDVTALAKEGVAQCCDARASVATAMVLAWPAIAFVRRKGGACLATSEATAGLLGYEVGAVGAASFWPTLLDGHADLRASMSLRHGDGTAKRYRGVVTALPSEASDPLELIQLNRIG